MIYATERSHQNRRSLPENIRLGFHGYGLDDARIQVFY